jgi:carbon-monoxide dehydrogenase large subunit
VPDPREASVIGSRARRIEDPVLLRGAGRFAAYAFHPDTVHMRVVRSPIAHGEIRRIDLTDSLRLPEVVAAWTAADTTDVPAIGFRLTPKEELLPYRQPVLARRVVRYVGEPVAVVFATSAYHAEDAAELVGVDIDHRDAHLDPDSAPIPWVNAEDATWAAGLDRTLTDQNSEATIFTEEYGNVDDVFSNPSPGHIVVAIDVTVGRHSGVPLECRGLQALYDEATEQLLIDGAAKVPFWNRDAIASMIGLPPQRVIVRETHVGGGFGPRGELYPEDVLVALAAMRLRRPIKWIEDRQEHLMAANHSRAQRHRLRALVRESDGWIEALDGSFTLDQGAYIRTHGATVASLTASMLPGPYVIPHFRARGHVRLTNKTPAGTYRSPGRYEGTFARERLMDKVADTLGVDRTDLRRTNFIPADEMPYKRPIQAMGTDLVHDSGDYDLLLRRVESTFELGKVRADVAARRANGELVGLGLGCFVEKSGIGPIEGARVSVDETGQVTVTSGASSVGQGVDTVLAQIVAEVLGIEHLLVRVVRGRTDQFDYGRGAFATRLAVMAGSAAYNAAEALVGKARRVAATTLRVPLDQVVVRGGAVEVIDGGHESLTFGQIAQLLEPVNAGLLEEQPGLVADGWFKTDHMTYPYGVHVAVVSLDAGTGAITLERFIVGYDVGRALNPTLVEGQIAGGAAQGIGGALYEEFLYSPEGTPQCTTFMDYLIPTSGEVPRIEILVTEDAPSSINPLGVKGAGEGGTTAAGAAIASAVDDALGIPDAITSLPIRPDLVQRLIAGRDQRHVNITDDHQRKDAAR